MKFPAFYHSTIKKYVILFGTTFNDIFVDRIDGSGNVQQTIQVQISYGPKEKYLAREEQNPNLLREVSVVYPRMSFEITGVSYDAERKLTKTQQLVHGNSYSGTLSTSYREVPYNFDFTLSIIAKNQNDLLAIIEQILPFYTPDFTVSVELIPELNIVRDIPIIIKSVNPSDMYEGKFEDLEYSLWTLQFTLKGYLYGPVNRSSVIKFSDANLWVNETDDQFIQGLEYEKTEVIPGLTANGMPTSNASLSVSVANISANNDYGFITTANNSSN